jgi:hypothetical protein
MELLAVGMRGYRRFEADAGNLDVVGSPIAIVGPNEVGKTSFLRALEHLNEPGAFERSEYTRGADGSPEVRAVFAIDEDERAEIAKFGGIGEPRIFKLTNRGEEQMTAGLEPAPTRDRQPRERAVKALTRVLSSAWFRSMTDGEPLRLQSRAAGQGGPSRASRLRACRAARRASPPRDGFCFVVAAYRFPPSDYQRPPSTDNTD